MKRSIFFKFVLLALICPISVSVVGCKKKTKNPTALTRPGMIGNPGNTDPGGLRVPPVDGTPIGNQLPDRDKFNPDNFDRDEAQFKSDTVYFEFDRATVKASEGSKLENVATYLKGSRRDMLIIEGHCDERGTEEYNRSLGERRALALREYLVNLGISGERITTKSWGEDRPAVPGNGEGAWSKNRRGEFILLKPKL